MEFQQYVTGNARSMAQIRDDIGYSVVEPVKWIARYQDCADVNRVQIYEDRGNGYSEDASYFVADAYRGDQLIDFTVAVDKAVKVLRIDPSMDFCIVKIKEMTWNGVRIDAGNKRLLVANGKVCTAAKGDLPSIVFATNDPNINLRLDRLQRLVQNELHVIMEITRIPETMAKDMVRK